MTLSFMGTFKKPEKLENPKQPKKLVYQKETSQISLKDIG